jgi:hypothetical protein
MCLRISEGLIIATRRILLPVKYPHRPSLVNRTASTNLLINAQWPLEQRRNALENATSWNTRPFAKVVVWLVFMQKMLIPGIDRRQGSRRDASRSLKEGLRLVVRSRLCATSSNQGSSLRSNSSASWSACQRKRPCLQVQEVGRKHDLKRGDLCPSIWVGNINYILRAFESADFGRSTSFSKSTKSPKSEEGLATGTGTPLVRGLFSREH